MSESSVLSKRRPCVLLGTAAEGPAWAPGRWSTERISEIVSVPAARLGQRFALDNLVTGEESPSRTTLREAGGSYRFIEGFWYLLVGTETIRALGKRALPKKGEGKNKLVMWSMGKGGIPPCKWYESREGVVMATMPHPSANNPWWTDEDRLNEVAKFLRGAASKVGVHAAWEKAKEKGT